MRIYPYVCCGTFFFGVISFGLTPSANAEETLRTLPQTCEQQLTLESFRAHALKNSPLVRELDRDYANELAIAFETDVLPNPELQVEQTFTNMRVAGANDAQTQASVGQSLRLSSFGSRSAVAKLITKSGDLHKRAKLMELIQKLTLRYETLAAYQQIAKILLDAEKRASEKVSLISDGVNKGLLSEGDESLFEGEQYRLQAQAKSIASTILTLQNELSQAVGYPCEINAAWRPEKAALPPEPILVQRAKESQIGAVARTNLLHSLTQEQVRLAELDVYPQITPRLIYQHTNDGGDFIGAGLSVALPLWNQNQAARSLATAERSVAEIRATFLNDGGLEHQIKTLRRAVTSSEEQAQLFSEKVIPSFKKALRGQEKLYAQGKGSVLQVWQTLRAFNEVQTQALLLSLEARTLRVELSTLIGEEL